jgi:hypothetical protein
MTNRFQAAAAGWALFLLPSAVAAQAPTPVRPAAAVILAPAAFPRWELAGHVAYLTLDKSAFAAEWNDWSDAAAAGLAAGYYWTRHLKLEADVFASTDGDVYSVRQLTVPGAAFPLVLYRRHVFQTSGAGTGISYQFLNNRWVHPFAGAGVEVDRQRETIESADPALPQRPPGIDPPLTGSTVTWLARPYLTSGAKFYVSQNVFISSGVRAVFDGRGLAAASCRTGVGVDF